MADTTTQPSRTNIFRTEEFRSILYQIVILSGVLLAGYWIFQNTAANLAKRGISSGFRFLFPPQESGFPIAEIPPIPLPEGGFLYFLIVMTLGLAGTWLLARWFRSRGEAIGAHTWAVGAVIVLVIVLPIGVLYFTADTLRFEYFDESKSYFIAFVTGVINTLKVSFIGCILATFLGLIIGISRLSSNWLVARLAAVYVEIFRNIPLLLQMIFWYFVIITLFPQIRQSIDFAGYLILNNRGTILPTPVPQDSAGEFVLSILVSLILIYFYARYVRLRQERTGEQLPVLFPSLGILILLPGLMWLILGQPFELVFPVLKGFNFVGGMVLTPEFTAVLVALVIYTAAFIAEIVRSGIQAVSKGQLEAASSVGLRPGLVMRLVILPQALRVIIPPQTSQYLNLTKNSSLAVAIGYPDLVSVGGTILNQSGQAIEIIAIWMMIYLTLSLLISLFMNWYNAKVKLVER
jgi:general L-amino acid transport system permease protein